MTPRRKPRRELFACPHCGADVAVGAKVCRECGSDASTGWQDQSEIDYSSVEIPDGYGPESAERQRWFRGWRLLLVALIAALALLALAFLRR